MNGSTARITPRGATASTRFRHKSLGEIARDLERIFDVQIVIRDASLPDEEYFATFASGWEIDELLDALNIRHTLRIRRDGRIIEIERAR